MTGILVVTGTRADFGLWRPILHELGRARFDVRLLVTAMHLDPRFGLTVDEVRSEGTPIAAEVACTAEGDSRAEMGIMLARAIEGCTPVIAREAPAYLLTLGDRGEQLGAGLAALHVGVPVAHVHGGEQTLGAIDDIYRDMLSRLASVHFVAYQEARERLLSLGVPDEAIEVTGAPGLDDLVTRDSSNDSAILDRYGVARMRFLILLQHPETMGVGEPLAQLSETIRAVEESKMPTVGVLPNSDAGGRAMAHRLRASTADFVGIYASIPRDDFVVLLRHAAAVVGNSSSGIIEAPLLGTPAVNVGERQAGRIRGDNVIDVAPKWNEISAAIRRAIDPDFRRGLSRRSPYGDGHAAVRLVARLKNELAGTRR